MMRNKNGFTLIEVLVAMVIVATVVLSIATGAITTIKSDTASGHASVATTLARMRLEQMRALRRTAAAWAEGTTQEYYLQESGIVGGGNYRRETVVDIDYNAMSGLARVTVRVFWATNTTPLVTLSSLY